MPYKKNREEQLDELWAAYRGACPDPEASQDFMPGLWQRIEARRSPFILWQRWGRRFVAVSCGACLLFLGLAMLKPLQQSAYYETTYLDSLAADSELTTTVALHPAGPIMESPVAGIQ